MDFSKIDMKEFGRHLLSKILKATAEEESYSEIIQSMAKKNGKFKDTSFPPNEFSLISDWDEEDVQDKVRLWR